MYTTKTVDSQTTSPWIPLDDNQAAFNVSVAVAVTGTLTYTVQFTLDNIQDPSVTPVAFEVSSLTGKTAAASASLRTSVKAVRLNVTAYTSGSATIGVRQGTSWDGVDFATSSGPVTLYQSGVPFWLPPGDGGSNGLSFTGTRGVFTLSAASPFAGLGATVLSGCYAYIPAGGGGLAGGLYWCQMSDDTNGEIFADTYTPGNGPSKYTTSPIQLPNCSAGRITQTSAVITVASFTMPGGGMGPNGIIRSLTKWMSTNSAGAKLVRVSIGSSQHFAVNHTTTQNNQLVSSSRQNIGIETAQIGNRTTSSISAWDAGASGNAYSADKTGIDTKVDQNVTFNMSAASNTDSIIFVPMQFIIQYGA